MYKFLKIGVSNEENNLKKQLGVCKDDIVH